MTRKFREMGENFQSFILIECVRTVWIERDGEERKDCFQSNFDGIAINIDGMTGMLNSNDYRMLNQV